MRLQLSFLDVLTCSLGGVLLMFMVLLAIIPDLKLRHTTPPDDPTGEKSPFVILATSKAAAGLPKLSCSDSDSQWYKSSNHVAGTDYAVLYSDALPPANVTVSLEPSKSPVSVTVEIFFNGTALSVREVVLGGTSTNGGSKIQVWPSQADGHQ